MAKFTPILPLCIIVVSGCALFNDQQVSNGTPALSAAVAEEPTPKIANTVPVIEKAPIVAAPSRSVTVEDVRRVQLRLREIGFDPGAVDGVAGAKTKAAFSRLQAGCGKLEPLEEKLPGERVPAREEVVRIQNELRAAGFNPGPADGVYGPRTKAVVAQLPGACALVKEFSGLDGAVPIVTGKNTAAEETVKMTTVVQAAPIRESAPVQTAQPREEIRILQLRLRDAGYDPGPFDGVMGAKTKAALAQYEASQRNSKIKTNLTAKISGQY